MVAVHVNPTIDEALQGRLAEIWTAATNAGGAVGLIAPADPERARALAAAALAEVHAGHADLAVATEAGRVVGFGFLRLAGAEVVAPHRAEVARLQRDPTVRGRGIGAAVLYGLEERAAARGIGLVTLSVRGGTGRERFYEAHGYRVVAVLPDWLEVHGVRKDSVVLAKSLDGRPVGPRLPVVRLDPDLPLPSYARPGDAGLDLHAREDAAVAPGARRLMPTGVAVAVPAGYVGLVHPRSGLALRHGLTLVNTPGTIDSGYRGEVQVPLINLGAAPVTVRRGDRIAQLLLQRVEHAVLEEVDALPDGVRGEGGFGSTGR